MDDGRARAVICDPGTASLRAWWYPVQLGLLAGLGGIAVLVPNGHFLLLLVWGCWALLSLVFTVRWLVKLVAVAVGSARADVLFTRDTLPWCCLGLLLWGMAAFVARR